MGSDCIENSTITKQTSARLDRVGHGPSFGTGAGTDAYPAEDVLWLYAERWGIENVCQEVTEIFGLQGLIGSSPKACIFQLAFCLLLYNMIQVVRGHITQAQNREPDEISTEKLFDDIEWQLIAWNVMFPPQVTIDYFARSADLDSLQLRLQALLGSPWSDT